MANPVFANIEVEARILGTLINEDECYLCLEPMAFIADLDDNRHPVIPLRQFREDSCGHCVHSACAQDLVRLTGQFVIIRRNIFGEALEWAWAANCFCGFEFHYFISADATLDENLVIGSANFGLEQMPVVADVEIIDLANDVDMNEDLLMDAIAAEIQDYAQAADWGEGWEHAEHYCAFCHEDFESVAMLQQHNNVFHAPWYRCNLCGLELPLRNDVVGHVENFHRVELLPEIHIQLNYD